MGQRSRLKSERVRPSWRWGVVSAFAWTCPWIERCIDATSRIRVKSVVEQKVRPIPYYPSTSSFAIKKDRLVCATLSRVARDSRICASVQNRPSLSSDELANRQCSRSAGAGGAVDWTATPRDLDGARCTTWAAARDRAPRRRARARARHGRSRARARHAPKYANANGGVRDRVDRQVVAGLIRVGRHEARAPQTSRP